MKKKPVPHPALMKCLQDASAKLLQSRKAIQDAGTLALAGALALRFDKTELTVLNQFGYLSLHEKRLIKTATGVDLFIGNEER